MSEGFKKIRLKPSSLASFSSEVPASVTATKLFPACSLPSASRTRPLKCAYKALGSMVPPDLEDTRNSVLAGSMVSVTD